MMKTTYYQNLLIDLNQEEEHLYEDQHDNNHLCLNLSNNHDYSTSASSSSLVPTTYFHLPRDQAQGAPSYLFVESKPSHQQHEQVAHDVISCSGTSETKREFNDLKFTILKREGKISIDNFNHNNYDDPSDEHLNNGGSSSTSSIKWMTSKMKMIKKMMTSDDGKNFEREATQMNNMNPTTINYFEDDNFKHLASPTEISIGGNTSTSMNSSPTIRSCVDCNTTTTPLWRSGPQGPKTLCNACGIRQRKARKAAMAAINEGVTPIIKSKCNKLNIGNKEIGRVQTKKRSKVSKKTMASNNSCLKASHKKLCFEEFALSLTKKLCLQKVFPPDEKEAAILLMAMSCGLIEG